MSSLRNFPLHPLGAAAIVLAFASTSHAQIYSTDFTTLDGWTVVHGNGAYMWAADATPNTAPFGAFTSAPASLNFNNGADIGADGINTNGRVRSPSIDLSTISSPRLRFMGAAEMEPAGGGWDILSLRIGQGTVPSVSCATPLSFCFGDGSGPSHAVPVPSGSARRQLMRP